MLWIGITGPIGGGKSTVANLLRQMGFDVLDADEVARNVLGPGTPGETEVLKTFGGKLRGPDGHLDRRALGRVVFGDPVKLAELENLIHPRVRLEVGQRKERLSKKGVKAAFYDVPLLYEKKMQAQFDFVMVVTADWPRRLERVQARSKLSVDEIRERDSRQLPVATKEAAANIVIKNNSSLEDLRAQVARALETMKVPFTNPG